MVKTLKKIIPPALLVPVPCLLLVWAGYYYQKPVGEQLRNGVMFGIGILSLWFSWLYCAQDSSLERDNDRHMMRFALFFTGGMGLVCALPLFPIQAWPLLAFAVALALFSNVFLGLFAYGLLVMSAVFLTGSSINIFFLYFLCGSAAILLFRNMERSFRPGVPLLTTLLYYMTAETACIILFMPQPLSWELFVLPVMNLFLTGLLLLLLLQYFGYTLKKAGLWEHAAGTDAQAGQAAKAEQPPETPPEPDPVAELMAEMELRQKMAAQEEETTYETPPAPRETQVTEDVTVRELFIYHNHPVRRRNCNMSFYIENDTETEFLFSLEEIVERIVEEILTSEACPYETHVNILLTDNEGIRRYNREYREIDRPTDVLSFPNIAFTQPADFSAAEQDRISCFDPESGALMLGDIIVSVDKIKEQADAYGHSQKREFAFLVAHSMLHLCGYDHMEPDESAVMKKKQITALQNIGITRDFK